MGLFFASQSPIREGRDSGQFLSLQKLERGAAARRNKSHLSCKAEVLIRRHRISPSDDGLCIRCRQSFGHFSSAGGEIRNFKNPDWPVPENSLGLTDFDLVLRNSLSCDVNPLPSLSNALTPRMHGCVPTPGASLQFLRLNVVDR